MASLLDVVRTCDNYVRDNETLVPFSITSEGPIIGLLRPQVVKELSYDNAKNRSEGVQENWIPCVRSGTNAIERIHFAPHLPTREARSAAIKTLCEGWRDEVVLFQDVMGPRKWRNELYPIYENYLGPHAVKDPKLSSPHSNGLVADAHAAGEKNHVFDVERSAAALFGLVTYGVHMTVYEKDDDGTIRIWVPTRAKTKQTYGKLNYNPLVPLIAAFTGGQDTSTTVLPEGRQAGWGILRPWLKNRWKKPAWKRASFESMLGRWAS
jgi:hypothetical protein